MQREFDLEVPQFSQVLPPLSDTPRGISETPMVRVPATASLLRAFQPRSSDSFHSVYSGLRPIYATQSHPKMLTLVHIQSLSGAKLRSGSESPNARSLYFLVACCSTKFFDEPSFCNGRYSTRFAAACPLNRQPPEKQAFRGVCPYDSDSLRFRLPILNSRYSAESSSLIIVSSRSMLHLLTVTI